MQAFSRFRLYHWLVALLFAAAYLTGEDAGLAHVWLGYGLLALLALRLTLALLGRARGFPRLWPQSPRLSGRIGRWVTLGVLSGSLLTLGLGMSMVDNRAALSEGLAMLMPAARAWPVRLATSSPLRSSSGAMVKVICRLWPLGMPFS